MQRNSTASSFRTPKWYSSGTVLCGGDFFVETLDDLLRLAGLCLELNELYGREARSRTIQLQRALDDIIAMTIELKSTRAASIAPRMDTISVSIPRLETHDTGEWSLSVCLDPYCVHRHVAESLQIEILVPKPRPLMKYRQRPQR